jgi:hypothetical protein
MDDEIIALAGIRPGQPAKKRRAAAAASLRMGLFFATAYVNCKSQRAGNLEIGSDQGSYIFRTRSKSQILRRYLDRIARDEGISQQAYLGISEI